MWWKRTRLGSILKIPKSLVKVQESQYCDAIIILKNNFDHFILPIGYARSMEKYLENKFSQIMISKLSQQELTHRLLEECLILETILNLKIFYY